MVTEKLTPYGLVVGLIPNESEAPSGTVAVEEKDKEPEAEKPTRKKSTKRVSK